MAEFHLYANWYAWLTMIDLAKQPLHIQQRYGYRVVNAKLRIMLMMIATILIAASAALFFNHRATATSYSLTTFKIESANSVAMTWQIARPENQTTYCVIRAQNEQRSDVGYATVEIAGGASLVNFQYTLRTESAAVLAEVLGCGASTKLRVPTPNFPPGAKIPLQDAPGVAPSQQ
jgi:hypothetical protein